MKIFCTFLFFFETFGSSSLFTSTMGAAALIGLAVAVMQAATQVQDVTLAHLPRLVVVAVVLAIGAGLLAIALAVLILVRRLPAKPWNPIAFASLAIALALVYVWLL